MPNICAHNQYGDLKNETQNKTLSDKVRSLKLFALLFVLSPQAFTQ